MINIYSPTELIKLAADKVGGIPTLAHMTGHPPQTIRNWHNKKANPPYIGILACLNAAGVSFELVFNK